MLAVERRCRALDRLVIRLVAQPERSMVHRHEQPRRGRVCHRDGLLGRAVVATSPCRPRTRVVSSHRSSATLEYARDGNRSEVSTAITAAGRPGTLANDGVSRWSKWACETSTRSSSGQRFRRESAFHEPKRPQRASAHVDANARKENRVGQDPETVEVHEHRGMSEPRQRNSGIRRRASACTARAAHHVRLRESGKII